MKWAFPGRQAQPCGATIKREPVDWHAHVYFDRDQADTARQLCETMRDALGIAMGRVHADPVGPHPRGSCQMSVPHALIGDALVWLARNRGAFGVFVHLNTGDDWQDHTAHALWLGQSEALRLDVFQRPDETF